MPTVDPVFLLLIALVQPVHGALAYRRYVARIKAGQAPNRARLYCGSMALEWIALAVLAVTWWVLERPVADLGVVAPGGAGFWIGLAIVAILTVFLYRSWQSVGQMTEEEKEKQRVLLGHLVHFLPRTSLEFRYFVALSITAGIVEELIYRGFLLWYLSLYVPMWVAVLLSSLIFGIGHNYQGLGGVIKITLAGTAFAALYIGSGSIWLPIVAHILVDILQGATVREILRQNPARNA